MKYQCTVCGQIIDTNESCPICGSDSSKIMEVGETNNPTMFRCLNCGRVFENAEECPYCQGTELYDLTHDEIYDKNKNKKVEKTQEDDSLSLFLKDDDEKFEDKPVDVSKVETPKEEDVGEPLFEEDDSSLIKDDLFDNSDVLVHEDKKEEKEETKEEAAPFVNELFDEPVESAPEEKVETEESETHEEPVVEEKEESVFEETKEVVEEKVESTPVEVTKVEEKEEHHCEFCEGDDCDCEENAEECSCENKEEHECCCNHEEHKDGEHHECCCGHHEENHECCHHEEEHDEEDVCHYDAHDGECCHHQGGCLKEQRDMLRKEILHSLLLKNMNAIKLDESLVSAEDKELFEQLLKETSLLKEESYYSLEELFEAKVETEKEIFKKRPSPLEGHLLFADSELLTKFKKGE